MHIGRIVEFAHQGADVVMYQCLFLGLEQNIAVLISLTMQRVHQKGGNVAVLGKMAGQEPIQKSIFDQDGQNDTPLLNST